MAEIAWRVCHKILIQNHIEHHLVVRLSDELQNQVLNPDTSFFVGITSFLIKSESWEPNFVPGDFLSVYYSVPETSEKKLLLTFDLYVCNVQRIQLYDTTHSTNYRRLFPGGRNVTFRFETNIGPDRMFIPLTCEFDAIIQQ